MFDDNFIYRGKDLKMLKERYLPGTRLVLVNMDGEPDMTEGLEGVVSHVDDIGQIHMCWDNGRTLALVYGKDSFYESV